MPLDQLLDFANHNKLLAAIAIAGPFVLLWVLIHTVGKTMRARAFEESRREIAAYVAEGTIPPEQAASLLALGTPDQSEKAGDAGKRLAELVAWYQVSSKDAAKLVAQRSEVDEPAFAEMVDLVANGMGAEEAIKLVRARKSGPAPFAGMVVSFGIGKDAKAQKA